MNRAQPRPGLDPAEVYRSLGPLTARDRGFLRRMSRQQRLRWFSNIYGKAAAPYAHVQYKAGAR